MDDAINVQPVDGLDGFIRIPGVFRRSEIEQVLRPGCDFHIQPERLHPGTHLFTVYEQEVDDMASLAQGTGSANHEDPRPELRARPEPEPSAAHGPQFQGEPSIGELRALHREDHLCFKCSHHLVCGMAKSLDANLLVTIARCLGFEPAPFDAHDDVCELMPIEPLATL